MSTGDPSQTPVLSDVTATYVNPTAYTGSVLADHPLGYWRLGDALDTSAMSDATGQYPGTYVNGAGGSPQLGISGDGDTAAYFVGNDQYGYVNNLHAPQQAYSLEAWVLPGKAAAGMVLQQGAAGAIYVDGQGRYAFVPNSNYVHNQVVLNKAATVVFTVSRRTGTTHWGAVSGGFAWSGAAGENSLRFTRRIGGRALRPGTYRLIAAARDRSGHLVHPTSATFTISR